MVSVVETIRVSEYPGTHTPSRFNRVAPLYAAHHVWLKSFYAAPC